MSRSKRQLGGLCSAVILLLAACAQAQSSTVITSAGATAATTAGRAKSDAAPTPITLPKLPGMPDLAGAPADRIVAIVNGDLILDSDVNEDLRLDELEPYGASTTGQTPQQLRARALERLINRTLILQQMKLQPVSAIPDAAVDKELEALRKNIPACRQYECNTQAGWDKLLASYGFTEQTLRDRWRIRMRVLKFIEQRFRMGIRITPEEIASYYEKTMLPQYAQLHVTPPSLDSISQRIEEVLLQQRVSSLLNDWLESLRAQGSIVVLHPGEDAP